jgi:sialate O-acetylesterase
MRLQDNAIRITFSNIGSGLFVKGPQLTGFVIAGKDGKFVPASARTEGKDIVVWSNEVSNPSAVRYAYSDNPTDANLYNKDGLPASPFKTDP